MYVPAPATVAGENRIVVLELEQLLSPTAAFLPALSLGVTEE
jgi:beta-galactosidase